MEKRILKKLVAWLCCAVVAIGLLSATELTVLATELETEREVIGFGYCGGKGDGTNLSWTLYEDGELVIEGSGAMVGGSPNQIPWYDLKDRIKTATIRSGVTSIGQSAFDGYSTIASVVIPDTVTVIGRRAFYGCSLLNDVMLPKDLIEIGDAAFFACRSLEEITIPSKVEHIGYGAFSSCISLQTISVETGNTAYCVEDGVLYTIDMKQLIAYPSGMPAQDYMIPFGVTQIGDFAFQESKITSVTIPDSVVSIGKWAFITCNSITEITIPANVSEIGKGAFTACGRLTDIFVAKDNETFCAVDGVLYSKDMKTILCYPRGRKAYRVVIPDSVTAIGDQTFFYCRELTEVIVPDGVTHIGDGAFQATGLNEIYLPNELVSIGAQAFYDCNSLKEVVVPGAVVELGGSSFGECNDLERIEFLGDAPAMSYPVFGGNDDLVVYYHEGAEGWTDNTSGTWGGYPLVMIPKLVCTISVGNVFNGAISVSAANVKEGEIVTVTATPSEGYVLKEIYVDGVAISGNTFMATGNHKVVAAFMKKPVRDGTFGYFSLAVVNTIIINGESVDICRWVWTPVAE